MQVAIDKAKEHDIAIVGMVQKHHLGRLGHYVEMAAAEGMVSMVYAKSVVEYTPHAKAVGSVQLWWFPPRQHCF